MSLSNIYYAKSFGNYFPISFIYKIYYLLYGYLEIGFGLVALN